MKQIIIVLLMFCVEIAFGQSQYLRYLKVNDSITIVNGRINAAQYYLNGVPFSGGDVISTGDNTFSGFNVLAGITRYINGAYFIDSVNITGAILTVDSIRMRQFIYPANGKGIYWFDTGYPSSIISNAGVIEHKARTHEFYTEYGNSLIYFDTTGNVSAVPFSSNRLTAVDSYTNNLFFDNAYGNSGTMKFNKITNQDTAIFKLPLKIKNDSLIFEHSNGAMKAILSTNASGDLVISTNRAVAITGDLTVSGFTLLGSESRYEKVVVKSRKLGDTTGKTYSVAHNIPNCCSNVTSFTFSIKRDTVGGIGVPKTLYGGCNANANFSTGFIGFIDTLTFNYFLPAAAYGLQGDSVIFRATYTP